MEKRLRVKSLPALADLNSQIDHALASVFKVDTTKITRKLEEQLASRMSSGWISAADRGLSATLPSLLQGTPTLAKINSFVAALGVRLASPLTEAQVASLQANLRQIWQAAKRVGAKEAKIKFSFNQADARAVQAINRQQVFWVGDFYSTHLSERIQAVSGDVLLQQGLPRQEAGRQLRDALQRELGIKEGGRSAFARNVPARYAGNPSLYFEELASTTAHQARTFGKLTAFSEAQIVSYRLINPDDDRTGVICQQMSGQVFSVAAGVRHMNRILDAENPADVKDIAPWLSGKELTDILGSSKPGSTSATDKLQNAGALLPPFHSKCRTEVVILAS